MSLGSHLDELRSRLIRAVVVPVLLSAGIFLVASHVRHFLTAPLVKALEATGQEVITLAESEGLHSHAESVRRRLQAD